MRLSVLLCLGLLVLGQICVNCEKRNVLETWRAKANKFTPPGDRTVAVEYAFISVDKSSLSLGMQWGMLHRSSNFGGFLQRSPVSAHSVCCTGNKFPTSPPQSARLPDSRLPTHLVMRGNPNRQHHSKKNSKTASKVPSPASPPSVPPLPRQSAAHRSCSSTPPTSRSA